MNDSPRSSTENKTNIHKYSYKNVDNIYEHQDDDVPLKTELKQMKSAQLRGTYFEDFPSERFDHGSNNINERNIDLLQENVIYPTPPSRSADNTPVNNGLLQGSETPLSSNVILGQDNINQVNSNRMTIAPLPVPGMHNLYNINTSIKQLSGSLIILRGEGSSLEVLVGQIEVFNGVRSNLQQAAVNPYPGEFRCFGGIALPSESGPLETATRELKELNLMRGNEKLKAKLFMRINGGAAGTAVSSERVYDSYIFVAFVDDNDFLRNLDLDAVNFLLNRRRERVTSLKEAGTFYTLSREERKHLCPKLHNIMWIHVSELLSLSSINHLFVNEWQKDEFHQYGVNKREIGIGFLNLVHKLLELGSKDNILDASLEKLVSEVARNKDIPESKWRQELFNSNIFDDDLCGVGNLNVAMHEVNQLHLLSYNLNILPLFASFFGTGQGTFSSERLEQFITSPSICQFDIIALQEVFGSPLSPYCKQRYLLNRLHDIGFQFHVTGFKSMFKQMFIDRKWTDSGLLIVSKFKILASDSYTFVVKGEGIDAGASKGVIYAKIKAGSRNLHVFNCHLQATHHSQGSDRFSYIRHCQLLELEQFIYKKTYGSSDAYILTGDFNIDAISEVGDPSGYYGLSFSPPASESSAYRHMLELLSPRHDIVDLLKEANNGIHVSTRPPRLAFPHSTEYAFKHKFPQRLDYVFFHPGGIGAVTANPQSTKIETFETPSSNNDNYEYLSDHWGISTTLTMNNTFTWSHDDGNRKRSNTPYDITAKLLVDPVIKSRDYICRYLTPSVIVVMVSVLIPTWLLIQESIYLYMFLSIIIILLLFIGLLVFLVLRQINKSLDTSSLSSAPNVLKKSFSSSGILLNQNVNHHGANDDDTRDTLYDYFVEGVHSHGFRDCLGRRIILPQGGFGDYQFITYDEVHRRVTGFGSGLFHLAWNIQKLKKGKKFNAGSQVGILADNCIEWGIADMATVAYSLVSVALYTRGIFRLGTLLAHSNVEVLILSRQWTLSVLQKYETGKLPNLIFIVQIERIEFEEQFKAQEVNVPLFSFEFVERRGKKELLPHARPLASDTATILFNWGSDGNPVGIRLLHSNLTSSIKSFTNHFKGRLFTHHDTHFSYFPLAYIAERVFFWSSIRAGMKIGFFHGEHSEGIYDDVRMLKPTFVIATEKVFELPTIRLYNSSKRWNYIYRFIYNKVTKYKEGLIQKYGITAVVNSNSILLKLIDFFFYKTISNYMGGKLKFAFCIGDGRLHILSKHLRQAMQVWLNVILVDLLVVPEAAGIIAIRDGSKPLLLDEQNYISQNAIGGEAVDNVSVYLVPVKNYKYQRSKNDDKKSHNIIEGELAIDGECIFVKHIRKPSSEADDRYLFMNQKHWYLTGIICRMNINTNSIFALGRINSLIECGDRDQYILAEKLEGIYRTCFTLIDQIWVYARRGKKAVAIISIDHELSFFWIQRRIKLFIDKKIQGNIEAICQNGYLRTTILAAMRNCAYNMKLNDIEFISNIHLTSSKFDCESGLRLPDHTLCRDRLYEVYGENIESLYLERDPDYDLEKLLSRGGS